MSTACKAYCALAAIAAFASATGCHPVPSVAGRGAQVLPDGETDLTCGGGIWQYSGTNYATDESSEFTAAYFSWAYTKGFGDGIDVRAGANNTQFFADVRFQPAQSATSAFVSLEVGCSAWLHLGTVALPMREAHLGILASAGGANSSAKAYLAARYHAGRRRYYDTIDSSIVEESSTQAAYFVGVEIPMRDGRAFKRVLLEAFHTMPTGPESADQVIQEEQSGFNVILGGFEF